MGVSERSVGYVFVGYRRIFFLECLRIYVLSISLFSAKFIFFEN